MKARREGRLKGRGGGEGREGEGREGKGRDGFQYACHCEITLNREE